MWLTKLMQVSYFPLKQLNLQYLSSFLQSLLDEPNPNSPANSQAAQLYQENKREYEKRVSAIVEQSWRDSWLGNPDSCSLHCSAVCAASFSGEPLNFCPPLTFFDFKLLCTLPSTSRHRMFFFFLPAKRDLFFIFYPPFPAHQGICAESCLVLSVWTLLAITPNLWCALTFL